MTAYLAGFSLGISLILAIGAQNAFVLKQGLKKQHVFLVCSLCAISDAILIALGITGFGLVLKQYPDVEVVARYAGALFLIIYSFKSFYSAFYKSHALTPALNEPTSAVNITLYTLAFTWLNPHVYLDTFVLMGSVSAQFSETKSEFAFGAITASFVFFYSLGYGARLLIPVFQKPKSWQWLEGFIGLFMLMLAIFLLKSS